MYQSISSKVNQLTESSINDGYYTLYREALPNCKIYSGGIPGTSCSYDLMVSTKERFGRNIIQETKRHIYDSKWGIHSALIQAAMYGWLFSRYFPIGNIHAYIAADREKIFYVYSKSIKQEIKVLNKYFEEAWAYGCTPKSS